LKEMNLFELSPGSRLARPVTGHSGTTMLETGTRLTEHYIERLKKLGVTSVFVQDGESSTPSLTIGKIPYTSPAARHLLLTREQRESKKNDEKSRLEACVQLVQMAESDHELTNMAIPFKEARQKQRIREILQEIVNQRHLADELGVLYQTDSFLFQHSLRVSMLSCVMGMANNFDSSRLYELVVGGLLFDIGMTLIPQELLRKKGPLKTEERALIRQHTTEGYHILSSVNGISLASAKCALLHHERYRGEGYPFGIKADDTPEFAQIVGLADLYDALMSPRHYRNAFTPSDAVEYLFAAGNYDFDISLIWLFLRNVFVFPVSSVIQLSSGQVGIVSEANVAHNHRPLVRIIREADGSIVLHPYELDLIHHSNLTITASLSNQDDS